MEKSSEGSSESGAAHFPLAFSGMFCHTYNTQLKSPSDIIDVTKDPQGIMGLSLHNCILTSESFFELSQRLNSMKQLRTLALTSTPIDNQSARYIAEGLKGLGFLRELNLKDTQLGPKGTAFIAEGLKGLTLLEELDLGGTLPGTRGSKLIAEALKGMPLLKSLTLKHNPLDPQSARSIGEGLTALSHLKKLDFSFSGIGEGVWFIIDGLRTVGDSQFQDLAPGELSIDLSESLIDDSCVDSLLLLSGLLLDRVSVNLCGNYITYDSVERLSLELDLWNMERLVAESETMGRGEVIVFPESQERLKMISDEMMQLPAYRQMLRLASHPRVDVMGGDLGALWNFTLLLEGDLTSVTLALNEYTRVPSI